MWWSLTRVTTSGQISCSSESITSSYPKYFFNTRTRPDPNLKNSTLVSVSVTELFETLLMWPNLCLVLYGAIQGSAGWFLDPVFLLKFWHLHPAFGICMGLGQSCKMSMHKSSQNWLVFAKFLVLPNFLPQEANCFTVISVTFCNSGLGLFLFWDILLYRLSFFLQNWSFSSMSPRVAKGRQGPRGTPGMGEMSYNQIDHI